MEKLILQEVNLAKDVLREAKRLFAKELIRIQQNCTHPQQAEAPYQKYEMLDVCDPPIRICLNCGITEEGWGSGYHVLNNPSELVGKIDRNKLSRLSLGAKFKDEDKGPLIRKQTTVAELVQLKISTEAWI